MIIGYDPQTHNFTKAECVNVIFYIKTRFFRYLVSIKKELKLMQGTFSNSSLSKTGQNLGLMQNFTRNTTSPKKRLTT